MLLMTGAAALCAAAVATGLPALRPLTIDDIARQRDAALVDLSFSEGHVVGAYTAPGDEPRLVRFEDGAPRRLVKAQIGAASPDGRWLMYLADAAWMLRDGRTGSERRFQIGRPPRGLASPPVWSSDSQFVAVHYNLADLAPPPQAVTVEHGVRVEVRDDTPEALHARASTHFNPHLLIWRVGDERPAVTAPDVTETFFGDWAIGADGAHTYYYAQGQHPYGGQSPFTAVRSVSGERGASREILRLGSYNQAVHPRVSPDGRTLAFVADLDAKAFGVSNDVAVADLRTGRVTRLTRDLAVSTALWGRDRQLYVLARDGAFQQLERVDLAGHLQRLTHDAVYRSGAVASEGGNTIAYTTADGRGRKELRAWSTALGRETRLAVIADPGARFRLGQVEPVSWATPDGLKLQGLLIYPPDYDRRRRYPVFVDVHGGGPGARLPLWSVLGYAAQSPLEWHLWASLGYLVFVPDYRSSGGYGGAVNTARTLAGEKNGDLGGIAQDALDVDSGVRWLLGRSDVDPARIALFGQSAGGARVNYLLTRSHLFAAGIIHDQIDSGAIAEDLEAAALGLPITWYGQDLTPQAREAQLSGFLFDGWRSTTPTLIMVGDPALGGLDPLSAETLHAMLLSVHIPTRFVHFLDDGHNATTPAGVVARFKEMKAWLDAYAPCCDP